MKFARHLFGYITNAIRRETLIADIEVKLKQQQELTPLFTIRWRLA
jgi:hypothetical protein